MELNWPLQPYWTLALVAAFLLVALLSRGNPSLAGPAAGTVDDAEARETIEVKNYNAKSSPEDPSANAETINRDEDRRDIRDEDRRDTKKSSNDNSGGGWRCACEGGGIFLPASMMKSIGGPSAAFRLGAGGCYHKQM